MIDRLGRFVFGFAACFSTIVIIGAIICVALWIAWYEWLPISIALLLAVIFLMACYVVGQLIWS